MTESTTEKPVARAARTEDAGRAGGEALPVSRREFLYYIWGASMVMLLGAAGGMVLWFALPRFRQGEFGGDFIISADQLPEPTEPPQDNPQGRFWLTNTGDGVLALYKVCTHLGCLYKWVDANERFECPCHGSKFHANGLYIEGPAPRGLDRFEVTLVMADGTELVSGDEANPIQQVDLAQVRELIVHTGQRVRGPSAGTEAYGA